MAKKIEIAKKEIVRLIYELSADVSKVEITSRAKADIWRYNLTEADVCDAVRKAINEGLIVRVDVTNKAKGHLGKEHYIFNPLKIGRREFWVKLGFRDKDSGTLLIIISTHK